MSRNPFELSLIWNKIIRGHRDEIFTKAKMKTKVSGRSYFSATEERVISYEYVYHQPSNLVIFLGSYPGSQIYNRVEIDKEEAKFLKQEGLPTDAECIGVGDYERRADNFSYNVDKVVKIIECAEKWSEYDKYYKEYKIEKTAASRLRQKERTKEKRREKFNMGDQQKIVNVAIQYLVQKAIDNAGLPIVFSGVDSTHNSQTAFYIDFDKDNYANDILKRTIYAKDSDKSGNKLVEALRELDIDTEELCEHLILSKDEAAKRFAVIFGDQATLGSLDTSSEVRKLAQKKLGEKDG